jgi:predicted transcriptional regulator of viral defense system
MATLCLTSALARHNLTDLIPTRHDIALPRGRWHPQISSSIHWHSFDPKTFEIGREKLTLERGTPIGLYNAERTIVDTFRLANQLGIETGHEALRRWLRAGGTPASLLRISKNFPRTQSAIRSALEILI